MAERRDILWRFLGDSKSLQSASKGATKELSKTQKGLSGAQKAAGALGVAFGAQQLGRQISIAVDAASDYNESINAVEVTMGDASEEIMEFGETAATELGLSKTAVNDAAVAFAAFGENINSDDVAGTFEDFTTRATDFASVMNLEVGDAISKFQSGLAGESEPLRKFGIDMSAAAVSAFAVANGIHESGKNMTEAEKQQARYGLLMQQTNKVQGDFARTSGEVANQQRIANAELENSRIELGQELLPLQMEWVRFQRKALIPALGAVAKGIGNMTDEAEDTAAAWGDMTDSTEDWATRGRGAVGVLSDIGNFLTVGPGLLNDYGKEADEVAKSFAGIHSKAGDMDRLIGSPPSTEMLDGLSEQLGTTLDLAGRLENALKGIADEAGRRDWVNAVFGGTDTPGFKHAGGIVPGATGQTVPIMAQGGERVVPRGGGGGEGINLTVNMGVVGDPEAAAQAVADLIQLYEQGTGSLISGVSV